MFVRRLAILFYALAAIIVLGTVAFMITEGVSVGYGFSWTLDTVTTLGSIKNPSDAGGRVVVVGLELLGIGTLFYGLATVAEFFVSGQLSGLLEERRTQRMIDSYSDHYIICGFGRVGRQVARDLRRAGVKHVTIDSEPSNREAADTMGVRYIDSYAADDEVLLQAGIERARAVIACVDSDAENIFIALTARGLRPDILIVARASAEDSEKKLLRAGADRVISPYKTSGSEMARVALHPQVGGAMQRRRLPDGGDRGVARVRGRRQGHRAGPRRVRDRRGAARGRTARGTALAAVGDRGGRHADRDRHPGVARTAGSRVPAVGGAERVTPPLLELRVAVAEAAAQVRGDGDAPAQTRVERSKRDGQGDYSTNVAMLLAPSLGSPPREIAERVGGSLTDVLGDELTHYEVAGPGFLNLTLSDSWYRRATRTVLEAGDRYGAGAVGRPERILIEFVSANPTGPLVAANGQARRLRRFAGADPRALGPERVARVLLQ